MNIFTIVGARPQFIKAAPMSATLRQKHTEFLVHTGQHYDDNMSEVFFRELGIPSPDANLGVGGGTHAEQTARMMPPLESLMQQVAPDWVLVYGDTNSTLAGALVAAKLNLRVAHVEAGLRSYNRAMPEEVNRVLTDHVSQLLFCPTPVAVANLAKEGIHEGVVMTGDIMMDAVLRNLQRARTESTVHQRLNLPEKYAIATIHRPANTDNTAHLGEIVAALNGLEMPVVFAVHPRTRSALNQFSISENLHLVEPLSALDMLAVLDRAQVAITDSGGLQKEAYIVETPCVTVRTETEWVETVESGWNRLADTRRESILSAVSAALSSRPTSHPPLYGDGTAAQQMVQALESA
jgi:UDP-N-acetylglucosamine 2-epimerase